MKHYFLKLIPPRPDFMATMTDQERSRLLGEVTELLDGHPALSGRGEIEMPYVTRCTRLSQVALAGLGRSAHGADSGDNPVQAEVPGLLDVAAEHERPR